MEELFNLKQKKHSDYKKLYNEFFAAIKELIKNYSTNKQNKEKELEEKMKKIASDNLLDVLNKAQNFL